MPDHLLVPYDGSPLAQRALRYACSEFGSATITVLYVVDQGTDETAASGWGDHPSEWEDWLTDRRGHAEDLFEEAEAIATEYDVDVETSVAIGRTADAVLQVAEEYGVDLIVVGAHARSTLEEIVLGSVARALVHRSPVPVTTLRQAAHSDADEHEE